MSLSGGEWNCMDLQHVFGRLLSAMFGGPQHCRSNTKKWRYFPPHPTYLRCFFTFSGLESYTN